MANYVCKSRTNYFRVTDEETYKELFAGLYCSDEGRVEDLTKEKDGVLLHGFGAYGDIRYDPTGERKEDLIDNFLYTMQTILPDDDAMILLEAGNEKLRYVTGDAVIVTATQIRHVDLIAEAINAAKEMVGSDFETVCMY